MTSHELDDQTAEDAAGAFIEAAKQWLADDGRRQAAGLIRRLALHGVTPDDLCNEAMVSLLVTVDRNGAPVDPSDGDAVRAYVSTTLRHRAYDQGRAVRRRRDVPWPDEERTTVNTVQDQVADPLLSAWLFECVRRVLHRVQSESPRQLLAAQIALAALTFLEVGAPPDAPRPETKGTAWTRAGWAALASVDRGHFFPTAEEVKANTATQRRRAALGTARGLLQAASVECGAESR